MTEDLIDRYDLRVPRYTSYPTAPHFGPAVDGGVYARWLAELDPALPLSLYFHIPFCAEMCAFCGCHTKIVRRYAPIARYLEALLAEIELVAAALPARCRASHLHWGGGSPTMLTGDDWGRILDRLRARFDIAADAAIAVELDPRTATEDYVRALAAAGVNRASLGVQDVDPEVQAAIRRHQPFEVTARVVGWLRGYGIDGLNVDLMYGLPHQTVERVRTTVERTLSLSPARIALFGYAHVPWMKAHQRLIDETALPGARERFRQAEAAAATIVAAGFRRVGLDHFARPDDALAAALDEGRLRRNFQGYTVDSDTLLGFGASAIGSLPQGYAQNQPSIRSYEEAVAEGRLPVQRGIALDADDRLRRDVIGRLMCDLDVDLEAVRLRHGAPAGTFDDDLVRLAPLAADGLVAVKDGRVTVPERGRPFVRLAAAAFDRYLAAGQARHSRAI